MFHKKLLQPIEKGKAYYKNVLFSGRFDPPHIGHWVTVLRLLEISSKVTIVVLNYDERRYYAQYAAQVFADLAKLSALTGKIAVEINSTHFAEISPVEIRDYKCDAYAAAGNFKVLNHVAKQGIPCIYLDRAYDYEAHLYVPEWAKKVDTK